MTAEVVVVNKSAIALAADSAATVSDAAGDRIKTYGANKLFALSKFKPIGVMIYSDTELMGMPWETIIKQYRNNLRDKHFSTVKEYASDLFSYISSCPLLFTQGDKEFYADVQIGVMFSDVKGMATKRIEQSDKRVTKRQVREYYEAAVKEKWDELRALPHLPGAPPDLVDTVAKRHKSYIKHSYESYFKNNGISLSRASFKMLVEMAGLIFVTGTLTRSTGVVVAGFGEEQSTPHLHAYEVFGIADGFFMLREDLAKSHPKPKKFDNPYDRHAGVYTFAQTDVVNSLVEGASEQFRERSTRIMLKGWLETAEEVEKICLPVIDAAAWPTIQQSLQDKFVAKLGEFRRGIDDFVKSQIRQVEEVVGFMPKDDMANLAAALVELTSVKRKMSLELETVGGPVDVAVISKGDGFVWISRKHYFKQELNLQFTENYFR